MDIGQGAKVVKSLNKNHKKGEILQEINKRGEGKRGRGQNLKK